KFNKKYVLIQIVDIYDKVINTYESNQEIIRRYFSTLCEYAQGSGSSESVTRIKLLLESMNLTSSMRGVVVASHNELKRAVERGKGHDGIVCSSSMQLLDGHIVTGSNSELMHASSALILNAVKHLAGIPKEIDLIAKSTIKSIRHLKKDVLNGRRTSLDVEETLICLAMSAANNPSAKAALDKLPLLKNSEVHLTHIPSSGDFNGLRKLILHVTSDPVFPSKNLHDE
ncbi:MAG: DUF1846 family protein, partial [Spirochaetia bacterium]|nr:DUF1846 family protein [Spirochaetia bacterium]